MVDFDALIADEFEAIDAYKQALLVCKDVNIAKVLTHILEEEIEHVKELREAKSGIIIDSSVNHKISDLDKKYQEILNKIETERKVRKLSNKFLTERVQELVAMGIDKEMAKTLVKVANEYGLHKITKSGG